MTELPATFGKYFLTEKLATGGMAEIYLGKIFGPGGFEKQLVIKQIHPRLSGQRHFVDLFVAEAKILVGLTHGNIVPVYELGVVDEVYFIAMEYIDGPTLYRFVEATAAAGEVLEPPVVAYVIAEILDGLAYAHRKGEGVIHRDLSPRNVMMSRDGEVKLVDFGIAIAFGEHDEPGEGAPTGSFPYMSPEQVRRQRLTAASDLFSVGVLAWEMLTGQRLFARATADETLEAVVAAPIPPPSSVRPGIPAKLDELVLKALARDVADRWASAAELLAAINRYLYSLDRPVTATELADLVARICPPVSGEDEAVITGVSPPLGDGVEHTARRAPVEPTAVSEPRTAVIPRDAAAAPLAAAAVPGSSPRGKRRGPTVRDQSFATHVEFERVLARATPLFPFPAILDELPAPVETSGPRTSPRAQSASGSRTIPPADVEPAVVVAAEPARPRMSPLLMLAGVGTIGLAGWLIYAVVAGAPEPEPIYYDAGIADAAVADAAIDAAIELDATVAIVDAAPRRDAGVIAHPIVDAGARPVKATASLKVGADPWGEVYIDGKLVGRTPGSWPVAVGAHDVDIVFPVPDHTQKKSFHIDLAAGEERPLFAQFEP